MSLRSLFAALVFRAQRVVPARELRTPRVTSTVTDGRVTPAREAELIQAGRQAVDDFFARSPRVEHDGHFDVPRFRS